MRLIVNDIGAEKVHIGYEGENNYREIVFTEFADDFAKYPDADAHLSIKPKSGDAYPHVLVREGDLLIWVVNDSDCAALGMGMYQVTLTSGGTVAKSAKGFYVVRDSIVGSGDSPDPVADWIAEASAALDALDNITASAENLPAGSSASAQIRMVDGHKDIHIGIPAGEKGDPGDPGADGVTPDFSIGTVQTLPAGSDATASVTGTAENPVLNLGIPQGEKGDPGEIPQETLDQIEQDISDLNSALKDKADIIVSSASGAIASFPDGAESTAKELVVGIEPVQDLHGYESPWPAGGGVNKVNTGDAFTSFNVVYGFTVSAVGDYLKIEGTYTGSATNVSFRMGAFDTTKYDFTNLNPRGFVISGQDNIYNGVRYAEAARETLALDLKNLTSGNSYSITIGVVFYEGSTVPTSFTPYSNICPISGWTGANVWDDPKHGGLIKWNQLAENGTDASTHYAESWASTIEKQDGVFTVTTTRDYESMGMNFVTTDILFVKDHKYYVAVNSESVPSNISSIAFNFTSNWTSIASVSILYTGSKKYSAIMTPSSDGVSGQPQRLMPRINASSGNTISSGSKWVFSKVLWVDLTEMFGSGNEPTIEQFEALFQKDFYPYNAGEVTTVSAANGDPYEHISISFPSEAGTVYGGSLTVNEDGSGKLVVDRAIKLLSELTGWQDASTLSAGAMRSYVPNIQIPPATNIATTAIMDRRKAKAWSPLSAPDIDCFAISNGGYIVIPIGRAVESIESFLAEYGDSQLCYPLATPITYDLTNLEVLELLKGINNVWADTGNTSVTYRADTKLFIEKKISELVSQIVNS